MQAPRSARSFRSERSLSTPLQAPRPPVHRLAVHSQLPCNLRLRNPRSQQSNRHHPPFLKRRNVPSSCLLFSHRVNLSADAKFVTQLFNETKKGPKIIPKSLLNKYLTSKSLFLKDMANTPSKSMTLKDHSRGGEKPSFPCRKFPELRARARITTMSSCR